MTQVFFARLLRLNSLSHVGRERGRFQTLLLASLNHFLSDEWDRSRAQTRGGGQLPQFLDEAAEQRYRVEGQSDSSSEPQHDRRWAMTRLRSAVDTLPQEQAQAGRAAQFDALKIFLSAEAAAGEYDALPKPLELSAGAVGVAVHRLRQRYGELVRTEVARTLANPAKVDQELNYLCGLVGG